MSCVTVHEIRKRYGTVTALDGVTLEARDGELLVVVGPSGCGKSTLLRDVTLLRPAARNVSMVFQSYALFPHMTVEENIGFGLIVRETPKQEVRARVAEAAAVVGVTELAGRRPYELSGGERQRVALARALVRNPDAFLLDEPLSNLDAGLRVEMRTELRRLQREVGATMLHVTHDQLEALTLGDRVAVLSEGRLRQVGTPEEVYRRPVDRFVAGFLGTPRMNFLDAREARPFVEVGDGVEVGVRPEHVRLDGPLTTRVDLVEVAGGDAFVYTDEGLVARVDADTRPREGDEIRLGVRSEDVLLFDVATGERIER